jgi:hypothetical protein
MAPTVSAVVTAFNGARFLRAAVESLLLQTLRTVEVLVVDDASTDETAAVLESFEDPRLVVLTNPENLGPFASANRALAIARGDLVARMDCDDLSAPPRLETQGEHLRAHPEIGILGSACRLIGEDGAELGLRTLPPTDLEIRWQSLFACPFQHSAVMLRRSLLARDGYDGGRRVGGDYDLWSRLLRHTRGANLAEPLVAYRRVATGITATRRADQLAAHQEIAQRTVADLLPGLPLSPERFARLRSRLDGRLPPGPEDGSLAGLLLELFATFGRARATEPGLGQHEAKVRAQAEALQRGAP